MSLSGTEGFAKEVPSATLPLLISNTTYKRLIKSPNAPGSVYTVFVVCAVPTMGASFEIDGLPISFDRFSTLRSQRTSQGYRPNHWWSDVYDTTNSKFSAWLCFQPPVTIRKWELKLKSTGGEAETVIEAEVFWCNGYAPFPLQKLVNDSNAPAQTAPKARRADKSERNE